MTTEAGWFQDAAKPWLAHHWDGQEWTGEAHSGGRVRTALKPRALPDDRRRIELEQLPAARDQLAPGVVPLGAGAVVCLILVFLLYQGIEDMQAGVPISDAIPIWLILGMACGLGAVLYGIVVIAITRSRPR